MKYCNFCEEGRDSHLKKCPVCGSGLVENPTQAPGVDPQAVSAPPSPHPAPHPGESSSPVVPVEPISAAPVSAAPVSAAPVSFDPASVDPVSAPPSSAPPAFGLPIPGTTAPSASTASVTAGPDPFSEETWQSSQAADVVSAEQGTASVQETAVPPPPPPPPPGDATDRGDPSTAADHEEAFGDDDPWSDTYETPPATGAEDPSTAADHDEAFGDDDPWGDAYEAPPAADEGEVAGLDDAALADAERKLTQVISRVNHHLRRGFDLYGLVGHPGSGKTHSLKALTYLLKGHGVDSSKARTQFHESPTPKATQRKVFDFAYTGPAGERWVFVDAGGELYVRLHENTWDTLTDEMTALAKWLQSCKGLFMFLHLNHHHFSRGALDENLLLDEDDETQEEDRRKARIAQEELAFFKSFLLFLRALNHEKGSLRKLLKRCQESKSLDEALAEYHRKAPRLEIPVMFFFSKADSYVERGFEVSPNVQFAPRQMTTSTAAFVASHLPSLFADVASQVDRFKFDFLQSYEEIPGVDQDGIETPKAVWEADGGTTLSIGLLSGLEFILRNQTRGKPWWRGPGLSTLQALQIHRMFNPGQWKNVRLSLRNMELSTGGRR